MPLGLKDKKVNLHTTTTTKVKTDHAIRPLLTRRAPPAPLVPHAEFLCEDEGVVQPPLPTLMGLEVEAI